MFFFFWMSRRNVYSDQWPDEHEDVTRFLEKFNPLTEQDQKGENGEHTWSNTRQNQSAVCFNGVYFNALSPYKPCEKLFQNLIDKIRFYILSMTLPVKIDKLYSILNISRQYLRRSDRKQNLLEWL